MTTATAIIDVDEPLERAIHLVPGAGRQARPEPPEPAPAAAGAVTEARTRPAHCRLAMHYED
ncbi:hypothetical protein ACWCXH_24765 [Kitasatospora sp. NPDC001660]